MPDLKKLRILVTPTSFGKSDPSLLAFLEEQVGEVIYNQTGRPLSEDELIDMLVGIDGCIGGLDQFSRNVINSAKKLKVISRYGVGLENVDLDAAKEGRIYVTYTPGANASSVADLTILLMLLLCRPVCWANEKMKYGEWPRTSGLGLEDKTVGIIGLGAIGRQVAKRLSGFGCKILAYDLLSINKLTNKMEIKIVDMDTLITESDIISLHTPVTKQTENMVNDSFIAKMKKGSFIVNTARGELIDESALINALENGIIAGAGLDAYKEEPLPKESLLLKYSQVITTPHMGAHTDSAVNAMGWISTRDCLAVLKGEKPKFLVV